MQNNRKIAISSLMGGTPKQLNQSGLCTVCVTLNEKESEQIYKSQGYIQREDKDPVVCLGFIQKWVNWIPAREYKTKAL